MASSEVRKPNLGADRVPQHADSAGALPSDEPPVLAPFQNAVDEDVDRGLDDAVRVELAGAGTAQHVAQSAERLVDQDEAERFHRLEVPVERGGHDAGFAGDLPQAQPAEAALGQ